jgi:glycerophosphoryl diester phosphodiesterase
VELEVRTTIEGHLVLMHDSTVDRTTNAGVAEMYFDHVRALSLVKDRSPQSNSALIDLPWEADKHYSE